MDCCALRDPRQSFGAPRAVALGRLPGLLLLWLAVGPVAGCAAVPDLPVERIGHVAAAGSAGTAPDFEALSVAPPSVAGPSVRTAQSPSDDPGWLARVQQNLIEREYRATASREGLQAPNRRHNLRTYFEPSGIRVHDRTAPGGPELLGLSLVGLGRGEDLDPVAPGETSSENGRVEIRRQNLVEWYANSPSGLEQGFTIAERPDGEGALTLELAVEHASAALRGEQVVLSTSAGRRLAYDHIAVVDATGAPVAARFVVPDPRRVRLVVADALAAYPLSIDPLLTEMADAQLESDQGSAYLGQSVSEAGDVNGDGYADVIVGAYQYDAGENAEGAAFVFLGSASGIADGNPTTAAAQLESDQALAFLGFSVSGAGDVNGDGYDDVIVGAYNYSGDQNNEGAAFVFLGSASGIADGNPATASAQLESDQTASQFGQSVSGTGDVDGDGYADVIVGAQYYTAGQSSEGAAFVFLGSASGIADGNPTSASAQFESDQAFAYLGRSVSGAGDVNGDGYADAIVGAYLYDAGLLNEGVAFVLLGSASGVGDGNPTTASAQLESNQAGGQLGYGVSGAGDVNGDGYADVIVGAPQYAAGQSNEGAAFVFLGSASGIADGNPTSASAQLESDQATAFLGISVSSAGDVDGDGYADVIVGANLYDAGDTDEGAAFVFLGGASGIADGNPTTASAQLESDQVNAILGWSVSGAGDVNADGYSDVIVGANLYDAGETDEGAAFVFLGSASGVADGNPTSALAQLEADQLGANLGRSVAGAGDVNGDGYADVVVGAPFYTAGQSSEGAAFVFLGSASGIADGNPATASAQLESDQVAADLGFSVAGAGDVNGDGYADVIVGADLYDSVEANEGAAFVFLGSGSGIADGNPTTAAAQLEADQANAYLGFSVAGAGDVNGDGYADVIAGAYLYDSVETDEGAAFVFLGGASGIPDGTPATASAQLESDQASANFGISVSSAGDVDGDGYADAIVGARYYDAGQSNEGAAFVFLGGASGIAAGNPTTASAQLESNQANAYLGRNVSGGGDVNGDGYADVIVGAYFYDAGQNNEGAAFVFLGSASGIADGNPATAAAQLEANQVGAALGSSVAGAGDVNADGYADVIVGAIYYDAVEDGEGAAFVFLGNSDGGGRPVVARQLRGDGSGTPVEPWGGSYDDDAFEVRVQATHPEGRGRVKLEVETCAAGLPFGDGGCSTELGASFIDVTATSGGVQLEETISGLASDTLYRWRARVHYAPYSVTQSGITAPPNPAHGPWRRVSAQANEADIHTVPEPGVLLSLASGFALLGLMQRRRTAKSARS